jgi:hypothetical protein
MAKHTSFNNHVFPEVFTYDFATQGLGSWGAPNVGHQRSVVGDAYHAEQWGNDDNHLTSKGGPGRVHLMTFADHPYWNYTELDGSPVYSDLTNARISMEVRGINGFSLANDQKFIVWITANHPYVAGKNVNWGFVAEPRVIGSSWATVEWKLEPDPTKWVWGAGLGIYDTYLSLQESLQNIHNLHFLVLGPDNAVAPSGAFEMRNPRIVFNRNGPGLLHPRWGLRANVVTLTNGDLIANHAPFTVVGGVRGTHPIVAPTYWEGKHLGGTSITGSFGFGVVNENFIPGAIFFADTTNGWGYMINTAKKRHNFVDTSWGSVFASGDTYMVAVNPQTGKVWFGKNGTWFNGGDPAADTGEAFSGLSGVLYPAESNGSGSVSWIWQANFGSSPFQYTVPAGFNV